MQKWEYCSIYADQNDAFLTIYDPVRVTTTGLRRDESGGARASSDAKCRKIAELGQEGWELVSVDGANCYFKRVLV